MLIQKNGKKNMTFLHRIMSYKHYIYDNITFFLLYRRKYRNYISVMRQVLKKQYPINAILQNGSTMTFNHYYEVYCHLMNLNYDIENDIVYVNGLRFYGGTTNGDIVGVFINNVYENLPVKDKVVIDIGANIGDSSIYFTLRGAKKVFAVEPNRESYEFAKKNIESNGFSCKVEPIWAGCAAVDNNNPDSNKPPLKTLNSIIDNYHIKPEILKIDCEGCEYDVILSSEDYTLNKFSHLQIEYHYGYKNLKEKLGKCGFHVALTEPRYFRPLNLNAVTVLVSSESIKQDSGNMFIGWLYAERL
jgi:FkbM family methyltransferase